MGHYFLSRRIVFKKSFVAVSLLTLLPIFGCKPPAPTPESAFKNFSKWVSMAQPDGMEKYGDKNYVQQLKNNFDNLAFLSELWPKEIIIISSAADNGVATLKVAGKGALGKEVTGTFTIKQIGSDWIVSEGYWDNLFGPKATDDQN